jgi:hypothetical protein
MNRQYFIQLYSRPSPSEKIINNLENEAIPNYTRFGISRATLLFGETVGSDDLANWQGPYCGKEAVQGIQCTPLRLETIMSVSHHVRYRKTPLLIDGDKYFADSIDALGEPKYSKLGGEFGYLSRVR